MQRVESLNLLMMAWDMIGTTPLWERTLSVYRKHQALPPIDFCTTQQASNHAGVILYLRLSNCVENRQVDNRIPFNRLYSFYRDIAK
jgi:hypothetical protein